MFRFVFHLIAFTLACVFSRQGQATISCANLTAGYAQAFWQTAEFTSTAAAIPRSIVAERELKKRYSTDVNGRYQEGEQGVFFGHDLHGLSYRRIPSPFERATVVLVPGMAESMTYYKELIYTLTEEGYTVFIFDPRGQGWSGNLGRSQQVVHVRDHSDYVDDLKIFLETIVLPHTKGDVTTLGNSNGALTAIRLAQRSPLLIPHLVAVAPPLRIFPDRLPRFAFGLVSRLRALTNGYSNFAMGVREINFSDEAKKAATRNGRFNLPAKERLADITIARSGPSNGWVAEVVKAGNRALNDIDQLTTHSLLLIPEADRLVVPRVGMQFGGQARTVSPFSIAGAGHFVLFERDLTRNTALIEIFRFLVNPKALNMPPEGDEIGNLEAAATFYFSRGELAFARYAMDEAIRVHEAKRLRSREWNQPEFKLALNERDQLMWKKVTGMQASQVALYKALTERRLQEIQGLYGN